MNEQKNMIKLLALQLQTLVELDSSLGISFINIPNGLSKLNLDPESAKNNGIEQKQLAEVKSRAEYTQARDRQNHTGFKTIMNNPHEVSYSGDQEKISRIKNLMSEVAECTACELCHARKNPVKSEGSVDAKVVFVASAPGREEDNFGRTFQGPAGQLITDIIEKGMKMPRESVYLSSIVKCRPQGNREPFAQEICSCLKYLQAEIEIVKPKVIVAVGSVATNILTEQNVSIEQTRGIWYQYNGIPVMPIYHPSFLLRQRRKLGRTNEFIRKTWQDIKQVLLRME